MTTHEEWVIKCPNCERAYDLFWISSGNTFGAKFWSDGCSEGNCTYPITGLHYCQICRWIFTIDQCVKIDPAEPSADELFLSDRPFLRKMQIEKGTPRRKRYAGSVRMANCELLVKLRRWSPQKDFEPILRLGWWWHEERDNRTHALSVDDALMANRDTTPQLSETTTKNIERLSEILPIDRKNALVLGDIQRRLGSFAAAINAYRQMPPHQINLCEKLVMLSRKGYRSVVQLR